MNPEWKKKWLTALRSGSYTQGAGCLKRTFTDGTTAHCCLGVLTELVDPQHPQLLPDTGTGIKSIGLYLPTSVAQKVGIPVRKKPVTLQDRSLQGRLAQLNDGASAPTDNFKEIIEWIEKNL